MTLQRQIKTKLTALRAQVDKLSLRERLLVFATVVMLFGSVWYLSLIEPLTQRAANSRTEIEALQARIQTANRSLEDQVLQISGSGTEYQDRFSRVQRRIDAINESLGDYASELIDPAEMARVMEGVLREQSKLRLIRIRNLSPEALSASADSRTATFYKHGIEIEFEGSYSACLDYLQEIENLPWRFYWQVLELEVLEYPRNKVRLEVSTLSLNKEWIGA
ncbi:MAG: type II secretion system protein M [Gammaproteobacteria bacterium]|nr:type II secretion system protein M [Gammaproteobacteria bacterium]MDH3481578.1 type II secretion system protein M [Gammaproteobacteria bacterium]